MKDNAASYFVKENLAMYFNQFIGFVGSYFRDKFLND